MINCIFKIQLDLSVFKFLSFLLLISAAEQHVVDRYLKRYTAHNEGQSRCDVVDFLFKEQKSNRQTSARQKHVILHDLACFYLCAHNVKSLVTVRGQYMSTKVRSAWFVFS